MRTIFTGSLRLAFLLLLAGLSQAGKRPCPVAPEASPECQVCSFNMLTPFSSPTNEITSVSGTITFYMVCESAGTMSPGIQYNIATISGGCVPSANRFVSVTTSGRSWQVEISTSGVFSATITSGSALPSGTIVDLAGSCPQ